MKLLIEDLGVAGRGEAHLDWDVGILARHPRTQAEYVVHPSFEHGFLVIDPRARSSLHIQPDFSLFDHTSRSVAQGADGAIYSLGVYQEHPPNAMRCAVLKWDWESARSLPVAEFSGAFLVVPMIECDRDGHIYAGGHVYRIDPQSGTLSKCLPKGDYWTWGIGGLDHLLYAVSAGTLMCQDTRNGATRAVARIPPGIPLTLKKDGAGRIIIPVEVDRRAGRAYWLELIDGKAIPVDASTVRLTETIIGNNEAALEEPSFRMLMPYVFADGSYISRFIETEVTYVDATGRAHTFSVERQDTPLRLFSIQEGGGKLWMSSILPLVLLSYDPASGTFSNYRTPTHSAGEIYALIWSGGRLFMGSYPRAHLTRYDPARPWRWNIGPQANPAHFGPIKPAFQTPNRSLNGSPLPPQPAETTALYLHRPYGKATDEAGNIYFSSMGGYGCPHSGLCRIDCRTETVTRWIYPETTMTALVYLPRQRRLLVCESRAHERQAIRFTFISPETGEVEESVSAIRDEGAVTSWLYDGDDLVYGLHAYRATLFAYNLKHKRIVASLAELGFGHHCYESLVFGPDGRIWGLTRECVFAVTRDLTAKERLADYPDFADGNFYRFGFVYGPDQHLYFLNGPHLMRAKTA